MKNEKRPMSCRFHISTFKQKPNETKYEFRSDFKFRDTEQKEKRANKVESERGTQKKSHTHAS